MASNTVLVGGISTNYIQNQWTWELSVTDGEKVVTVGYPLTIEFNIVRNTFASANTATFNIYNLSPATRSREDKTKTSGLLFQDRFNTSINKFVIFKAGYNDNLVTCFFGRMQEAYSRRQGTEVITAIQCMDLGIPTDYVNVTFEAGTKYRDAYKAIANNATGLTLGAIGLLEGAYKTPVTLEGNILDVLNIEINLKEKNEILKGYDVFGKAYGYMLRNDLHDINSIEHKLMQEQIKLDSVSEPFLYGGYQISYPLENHELYLFSQQFKTDNELD